MRANLRVSVLFRGDDVVIAFMLFVSSAVCLSRLHNFSRTGHSIFLKEKTRPNVGNREMSHKFINFGLPEAYSVGAFSG